MVHTPQSLFVSFAKRYFHFFLHYLSSLLKPDLNPVQAQKRFLSSSSSSLSISFSFFFFNFFFLLLRPKTPSNGDFFSSNLSPADKRDPPPQVSTAALVSVSPRLRRLYRSCSLSPFESLSALLCTSSTQVKSKIPIFFMGFNLPVADTEKKYYINLKSQSIIYLGCCQMLV